MKLTKDNIIFIDTYLKNTHISYIDVRMELLDHIAASLEKDMTVHNRSFYDAFKAYMVQHKKQIERDYEKLRKELQNKSFKVLGRKMLTLPFVILFLVSAFLFFHWNTMVGMDFPYVKFVWGIHLLSIIAYIGGMLPKAKYRFAILETLSWPILLSSYFLHLFFNLFNEESFFILNFPRLAIVVTSLFFTATSAFLVLFFQKREVVKQKFASL